ncbi:MAG: hypothetical protein ACYC6C_13965 [Coriobacteriia bacterium]
MKRKWPHIRFSRIAEPRRCSLCQARVRRGLRIGYTTTDCHWFLCDECAEKIGEFAWEPERRPLAVKVEEPLVLMSVM